MMMIIVVIIKKMIIVMVILIMNQKRKFIIDSDNDKKEKYNGNYTGCIPIRFSLKKDRKKERLELILALPFQLLELLGICFHCFHVFLVPFQNLSELDCLCRLAG